MTSTGWPGWRTWWRAARRGLAGAVAAGAVAATGASTGAVPAAQEVEAPTFRNHIQPLLTRAGCNMGACHGAAAGKNGLYLSLRGYHDEADWLAITRHVGGRRLRLDDPGRSLLLLKATGTIPHKGGQRFTTDSPEYATLARWIALGAPGPGPADPRLDRLEVLPGRTTLARGEGLRLRVQARFSDGRVEDVTRWAKFSSAQEGVANVSEEGEVRTVGSGEGAVSAWYLSQLAVARLTVPATNRIPAGRFEALFARNFIDEHVHAKLRELNLPPSPRADDSTFLRRATLDTIGMLPSVPEVRAFPGSHAAPAGADAGATSRARRDAWIDRPLARPEFVDYWTYKWSDLLLVNSRLLTPKAARAYHAWIRGHVERNTPWDAMVRELVTARGSNLENGAVNFYLLHDDPRAMAETVTQAFLGMSVGCARCHNHPSEKWTHDDYFALAGMFARVRLKNGPLDGERILVCATAGEVNQPRTGRPQPPRPLEGPAIDPADPADRRVRLAEWLTSPGNPGFARAIVNRVWANFFSVGLVEKVDDLRASNPASHEALLQAAADFLVRSGYDLKALVREILRSETYQRSSEPVPGNADDTRFLSHYLPRRLMAEVILDAYSQVTGMPTLFQRATGNGDTFRQEYPFGTRALQLPDSQVASYFLKSFGKPDRVQTCECERTGEPSVAQVLHLANGATLAEKIRNCITREPPAPVPGAEAFIEEIYLRALGRPPSTEERRRILDELAPIPPLTRGEFFEDLLWVLMSGKEFLCNH
ncbi:MAG: DUF1549 and DUF1553 domain-containing protein [Verrucomicrobiota bacterium]